MSENENRRVVMLTGDLMFSSRVKSAAQRAGWTFAMGAQLPEGDLDDVHLVILDLSTRSGLTESLPQQCLERCPDATVMAYGPHVHVEKLKAAREAGIGRVLTNGQFDSILPSLFESH